jgi:hypothetical protein
VVTLVVDHVPYEVDLTHPACPPVDAVRVQSAVFRADVWELPLLGGGWLVVNWRAVRDVELLP